MKKLFFLIALLCCIFIEQNVFSQGIPSRQETNIDKVYTEYGLSGDGVVIAIIDRGINYSHEDFLDEGGNTRVLFIYDMINPAGANDPDNPYGIGTIFDESEINSSLEQGGEPLTTDRYGHGTATAGIAGGDGSGTLTAEFHGVAPDANFIIVKAVHDYFPPFDGQPGQDGFYDPSFIPVALQFIKDKLNTLDRPSVTLLNMGSIGGPTDGTSTIARAIDNFVDQGFPFVCGVGDDGGNYNHASTTLTQDESIDLTIEKNVAGNLRIDLWYDEADRLEVTITRPDNTTEGPFPAPASASDKDDRFLNGLNYYHRGADMEFFGATSERREIMIDITGPTGEYTISLKATTIGGSGMFHATLNPATFSVDNKFTSHQVWGYSINDFASAAKAIVPTDYIVKSDWVDMDGIQREITGQGVQGGIWAGSSLGPTHDGRLGVDFAACGEVLYGAYSPNTYYSSNEWLLVQGGDNKYGIQNAVSAAAPLTMGVIALMLEHNPNLKPSAIKTALQNSARKDIFTDTTANRTYGHGKLDAYEAVKAIENTDIDNFTATSIDLKVYPNPTSGRVTLEATSGNQINGVEMYRPDGSLIMKDSDIGRAQYSLIINKLLPGIYFFKVTTAEGTKTVKVLKQ